DGVAVNVMEGDSVTLNTSVKTNQQEKIRWYFNASRIAEISGDLSHICRDVQCNKGTERFRGRLKLDHQTGSLTITNTRTTDSGNYHLKISNSNNIFVTPDGVSVFVMEGDSVTLHTDVKTNQEDRIRWYFNDTRIAQITGDLSKICTDVQCNEGTERFRGRLKLDHQTGSLTIMNITNTDTGHYKLKISSRNNKESIKTYIFAVHGVFAADRDEMKRKSVKEGESVTLDPCEVKNPNDLMMWYFNDIPMAKINRDLSYICTDDDQCKERFRDRLKLDHQTGSLTITNTRTTDDGEYKLKIINSNSDSEKIFSVSVQGESLCLKSSLVFFCYICIVIHVYIISSKTHLQKQNL
uniref:Ig-like domain-containing protein n=1 Tax=Sinocyclocheilus grahami TaxID=75366 RepID=A0A672NSS5_SINGR